MDKARYINDTSIYIKDMLFEIQQRKTIYGMAKYRLAARIYKFMLLAK